MSPADDVAERLDGRALIRPPRGPMPLAPGIWLGIGLGGFADGIVLHQILQWHHMLTSAGYPADSLANLTLNTVFDGLFHAVTWIAVAVGLLVLHRRVRAGTPWSGRRLLGGMAIGWGAFNLVEGVIDHHVLGLHHVREASDSRLAWDLTFLGFGAALVVAGVWLARRAAARHRDAVDPPGELGARARPVGPFGERRLD